MVGGIGEASALLEEMVRLGIGSSLCSGFTPRSYDVGTPAGVCKKKGGKCPELRSNRGDVEFEVFSSEVTELKRSAVWAAVLC